MGNMFRGDASDIYALAGDLSKVGATAVPALRGVMREMGDGVAREWKRNAEETLSGENSHAKRYPDSITAELVFDLGGVSVDVGPTTADKRQQGFLGPILEFGGERSPAYLHGLRALDGYQARAEKVLDAAVAHLFR